MKSVQYMESLVLDHQPVSISNLLEYSKYSKRYTYILINKLKKREDIVKWDKLKLFFIRFDNNQFNWSITEDELYKRGCPCGEDIIQGYCNVCTDAINFCIKCEVIFNCLVINWTYIFMMIPPSDGKNEIRYCRECDKDTFHKYYEECLHCMSWGYTCMVCDNTNTYGID